MTSGENFTPDDVDDSSDAFDGKYTINHFNHTSDDGCVCMMKD